MTIYDKILQHLANGLFDIHDVMNLFVLIDTEGETYVAERLDRFVRDLKELQHANGDSGSRS